MRLLLFRSEPYKWSFPKILHHVLLASLPDNLCCKSVAECAARQGFLFLGQPSICRFSEPTLAGLSGLSEFKHPAAAAEVPTLTLEAKFSISGARGGVKCN